MPEHCSHMCQVYLSGLSSWGVIIISAEIARYWYCFEASLAKIIER